MLTQGRLRELLDYDPKTGVFRWRVGRGHVRAGTIAGSIGTAGYRSIGIDRHDYLAHRLAWFYVHGEWPSQDTDHRDLNRDDNRVGELRGATRSQNMGNGRRRSTNTSGYKGVYFHRGARKWLAQIVVNGQHHYLGLHPTPEAAHNAYRIAAIEHFGAFARP